ncbi:hypothetical protein [Calothrix sp. NIES-2100]
MNDKIKLPIKAAGMNQDNSSRVPFAHFILYPSSDSSHLPIGR